MSDFLRSETGLEPSVDSISDPFYGKSSGLPTDLSDVEKTSHAQATDSSRDRVKIAQIKLVQLSE